MLNDDSTKTVTVEKLRLLLDSLRPDDTLACNAVGNLAIMRNGACVGFVNFNREEVDLWEEGDANGG